MNEKTYKVSVDGGRSKPKVVEGNFEYLKDYFGNTLLIGNRLNPKIKKDPKNIKEFMTALQKSFSVIECSMHSQTFVDLIK